MMRLIGWVTLEIAVLFGSTVTAQLVQAPFGPGGTWNVYERVNNDLTWEEAAAEAEARQFQNIDGRLMDIHSPAENALAESFATDLLWIGLTDREGAAPEQFQWGQWSPQESFELPDRAHQGWAWTSGDALNYVRWLSPSLDGRSRGDAVAIAPSGFWSDERSGFLPDSPVTPSRQPGTSTDERSGAFPTAYLVEYAVQSSTPIPGVELYQATPRMPAQLPGIRGGQGTLGLTEYRGDDLMSDRGIEVVQNLEAISKPGQQRPSYDMQLTKADVSSLATNNSGGPVIKESPIDFPSNSGRGVGMGRVSVAQGSIYVPVSGKYTIQVNAADGFGLKIGDAEFLEAGRSGVIDDVDPGVLYDPRFTGVADARGVVELSAGKHDFQFYSWANSLLAHWEITSTLGSYTRRNDLQWEVLGSNDVQPDTSRGVPPLVLVEPATVINVNEANGGYVPTSSAAETAVRNAVETGQVFRRDDIQTAVLRDANGIVFRPGLELDPNDTYLFPINDPQFAGTSLDVDHFSTGLFGKFTVDDGDGIQGELQQITVALHADDRAQLRVVGVSFLEVLQGGTLEERPDGDVQLVSSKTLANANVLGLIELQEGKEYSLEAFSYDDARGAGLEVWAAWGRHLQSNRLDPMIAFPLSTNGQERMLPANVGLSFVADDFVPLRGDYNVNGVLDAADLDVQSLAMSQKDRTFDLNQDGQVTIDDRYIWLHEIAKTVAGDANFDRLFSSADLVQVFQTGRYETTQSATWAQGDFNGDLRFTTGDLVMSFQDGYYEVARPQATSVIPEPSICGGCLIGGIAVLRRLRNVRWTSSPPK